MCHVESNNAFRLVKLAPGAQVWSEAQSRENFAMTSLLVNPGDPATSRLLLHPLAPERGGDPFHSGGRQFSSNERSRLEDAGRVDQWSEARRGEEVAARPAPSAITMVLMRLGTSPTGTTAVTFMALVSIAVTDRRPALEM